MNPRVTVGLLAVLIALGAYVYFGPPAGSAGPGAAATPTVAVQLDLWRLDDGQIQTIQVNRGADQVAVSRNADGWTLTPPGVPGDNLRINSLTFRLASLRATRRLDSVTNLGEYGLGTPAIVSTIGMADGTARTLKLGAKAPAESGTYAMKDADTTVYLISNAIAQDLERLLTEPPIQPSPSPAASPGALPPGMPPPPAPPLPPAPPPGGSGQSSPLVTPTP